MFPLDSALDVAFAVANLIAMIGWVCLFGFPRARWGPGLVSFLIVPGVLAVMYVFFLVLAMTTESSGNFFSLDGIRELFTTDDRGLLAAWIHYLAFDLFVGAWIVRDNQSHPLPHGLIVLVLIPTLMAGPAGLLLYFLLRGLIKKRWRANTTVLLARD